MLWSEKTKLTIRICFHDNLSINEKYLKRNIHVLPNHFASFYSSWIPGTYVIHFTCVRTLPNICSLQLLKIDKLIELTHIQSRAFNKHTFIMMPTTTDGKEISYLRYFLQIIFVSKYIKHLIFLFTIYFRYGM